MSSKTSDAIRNITPIAFGAFGAAIVVATVFSPNLSGEQRAYGIGAGTTAIGTGGGIAKQSGESTSESEANVNVLPARSSPPYSETGYVYNPPSLEPSDWQQYQRPQHQYMGGHQGSAEYRVISPDE